MISKARETAQCSVHDTWKILFRVRLLWWADSISHSEEEYMFVLTVELRRLQRVESLDYKCNWHLTTLKVRPRTPPGDNRLWACLWRSRCPVCIFDICCSSFLSFILFPPFSCLEAPKFHTGMNQLLNFSVITFLLHPFCAFIGLWWKTINLAKSYWATQER